MSAVLAVDPGLRACGVAVFRDDGELLAAGLVENPVERGNSHLALHSMAVAVRAFARDFLGDVRDLAVVCERMQLDGRTDRRRMQAVLDLAVVSGLVGPCALYEPREWKGGVPKAIHQRRILDRLTSAERGRIASAGALTHNVVDAVGIGLHHLGRGLPRRGT